ncbi:winged helix-turn-helix transcriptional regulator [Sphingomonas sp. CFBP 13706]|uniref:winged helix-turn-helix transcriptional regulator n=1 Tax=Sphingomonas sp. CFBP 13706 TaxID=2775314 RepID=UPI00406C3B9E
MEKHTIERNDGTDGSGNCVPLDADCPVLRAVGVLGGKWKLHIVYHLIRNVMRFGELQRAIPGVTQQMLTAQLREMEADGIVHRKVYAQVPPKVEYSLTEVGTGLRPLIDALVVWGQKLPKRIID